jgi:hypothetical protein
VGVKAIQDTIGDEDGALELCVSPKRRLGWGSVEGEPHDGYKER